MPKKYLPKYDYTGESHVESDDDYWYIYLKSTGVLSLEWPKTIDVFLVGGGGSGGNGTGAGGGGGGYTANGRQISIAAHQDYRIVVGLGGVGGDSLPEDSNGENGTPSIAFGLTAEGGMGGLYDEELWNGAGGNGGSGGGAGSYSKEEPGGDGGSNGGSGKKSLNALGGVGQRSSTHAFADSRYPLYAGGGGGYCRRGFSYGGEGGGGDGEGQRDSGSAVVGAKAGAPNTGGGGGGGSSAGAGGSGIVIIRGAEQDYLPVFFEDMRLQEVWYDGTRCDHLIFNGQQLY